MKDLFQQISQAYLVPKKLSMSKIGSSRLYSGKGADFADTVLQLAKCSGFWAAAIKRAQKARWAIRSCLAEADCWTKIEQVLTFRTKKGHLPNYCDTVIITFKSKSSGTMLWQKIILHLIPMPALTAESRNEWCPCFAGINRFEHRVQVLLTLPFHNNLRISRFFFSFEPEPARTGKKLRRSDLAATPKGSQNVEPSRPNSMFLLFKAEIPLKRFIHWSKPVSCHLDEITWKECVCKIKLQVNLSQLLSTFKQSRLHKNNLTTKVHSTAIAILLCEAIMTSSRWFAHRRNWILRNFHFDEIAALQLDPVLRGNPSTQCIPQLWKNALTETK